MIEVRHRSASSRLDSLWEFDPARKAIEVVFRLGSSEPVAFTIPVCAVDRPRIGAHPIARLDGESWRLLPSFFVVSEAEEIVAGLELYPGVTIAPPQDLILEPRDCRPLFDEDETPCPLHRRIGCGTQLVLTHASATVEAELSEL